MCVHHGAGGHRLLRIPEGREEVTVPGAHRYRCTLVGGLSVSEAMCGGRTEGPVDLRPRLTLDENRAHGSKGVDGR